MPPPTILVKIQDAESIPEKAGPMQIIHMNVAQ